MTWWSWLSPAAVGRALADWFRPTIPLPVVPPASCPPPSAEGHLADAGYSLIVDAVKAFVRAYDREPDTVFLDAAAELVLGYRAVAQGYIASRADLRACLTRLFGNLRIVWDSPDFWVADATLIAGRAAERARAKDAAKVHKIHLGYGADPIVQDPAGVPPGRALGPDAAAAVAAVRAAVRRPQ